MRSKDYKIGMLCAIFSAVTWGFLPIYWQALRPVDSVVIIFYRIIFVAIVTFVASLKLYGMKGIKAPLRIKGNKLKFFFCWPFNYTKLEHLYCCCKCRFCYSNMYWILYRTYYNFCFWGYVIQRETGEI